MPGVSLAAPAVQEPGGAHTTGWALVAAPLGGPAALTLSSLSAWTPPAVFKEALPQEPAALSRTCLSRPPGSTGRVGPRRTCPGQRPFTTEPGEGGPEGASSATAPPQLVARQPQASLPGYARARGGRARGRILCHSSSAVGRTPTEGTGKHRHGGTSPAVAAATLGSSRVLLRQCTTHGCINRRL